MTSVSRRAVLGLAAAGAAWAVVGCRDGDDEATDEDDRVDVIAYGDEAELQRGALSLPDGAGPHPVVVLVHGGFWRPEYERSLMDPLAESVVAEGWAAWNIDYRPVGEDGGWPTTFTDVAAAVDHLAELADDRALDLDRMAVVGHSAGGTLALWSAARAGLPADAPGAAPTVTPAAVVAQAGVVNLAAASLEQLGRGAVDDLMGGSTTAVGSRYGLASPIERIPLDVPTYLVHGLDDPIVPAVQSETYRDRATEAGDDVTAALLEGVDHFEVIDPESDAWAGVLTWLGERLA
ncbi:MAG TPA: alpha/beta hydrolase [Iamia sp.]